MVDNSNPYSPGPGGKGLKDLFTDAVGVTLNGKDAYVASAHWVSHIPGIVYMDYCKGQCDGQNGRVLRDVHEAFGTVEPCRDRGPGVPACVPSTQLHGHQHFFQRVRLFSDPGKSDTWGWPQTYIVGQGGTKADSFSFTPDRCAAGIDVPVTNPAKTLSGHVWAEKQHGFVAWRRAKDTLSDPAGWATTPYWFSPPMASAGDSPPADCVLK